MRAEPIVQVAVSVVEQERGLELQINFPESTFATMLPIVSVIEAAMVLKIEVFSALEDANWILAESDLKMFVICVSAGAIVTLAESDAVLANVGLNCNTISAQPPVLVVGAESATAKDAVVAVVPVLGKYWSASLNWNLTLPAVIHFVPVAASVPLPVPAVNPVAYVIVPVAEHAKNPV